MCGKVCVELDKSRDHVAATRMILEHAEQVTPVSGAHADDTNRPWCAAVERGANHVLHDAETPRQLRSRLVAPVPLNPLAHRKSLQNDARLG
jgi:hypothetical protein